MDRLEQFFESEKQRINRMEAPQAYEDTVEKAILEASQIQRSFGSKIHHWFSRNPKIWLPSLAIAATVLFAIVSFMPSEIPIPSRFQGIIGIEPLAASDSGIDPAKGFLITSSEAMPEELVREALMITPGIEYKLEKSQGGKEYKIIPEQPLVENTVYKIAFDPQNQLSNLAPRSDHMWAFQTIGGFAVKSVLPMDASSAVPVSTGIEIIFSQTPDLDSVKQNVTFEPALAGVWSLRDKTAVFVPESPLAYASLYKIMITGAVQNQDRSVRLEAEQTTMFETEQQGGGTDEEQGAYFELSSNNKAFRPSVAPYIEYYQSHETAHQATIKVWRYPNKDAYKEALNIKNSEYSWCAALRDQLLPTENLLETAEFTLEGKQQNWSWYFYFPEPMETGYYLAEISLNGIRRQMQFQVTELSAYLAYNEDEALLWVNDMRSGQPVFNASIQVTDTKVTAVTDETGTAVMKLQSRASGSNIFEIQAGTDELIMNSNQVEYRPLSQPLSWRDMNKKRQAYWNYLYVDRPLYRPGDTVSLFGLIAPREENAEPMKEVTITLSGGSIYGESQIKKTFAVNNGILEGSFELPMLIPEYYSLSLSSEGVRYCSTYFSVQPYEKPSYQLSITPSRKGVMAGDLVTWTTKAAFFEGTPLPELPVAFSGSLIHETKRINTDRNGEITFDTKTDASTNESLFSVHWVEAEAIMPEIADIYRQQSIFVFNSDVDIESRIQREGSQFECLTTAYSADPDKVEDWNSDISKQSYSPYTEALVIKATLERHEWDKVLRSYTYDPYTKQNNPVYDYNLRKELENVFEWTYQGPDQNSFKEILQSKNAYTLTLEGMDRNRRPFKREFYIPALNNESNLDGSYGYMWLQTEDSGFTADFNEEVTLRMYSGEAPLSFEQGNMLFYRSREKLMDHTLAQENAYTFRFLEAYLPNINVMAVYFDGRSYYPASNAYTCLANPSEREAVVQVKTDKEAYAPGETAKLELTLTDKAGTPMEGYVNLSLIDEALLAIEDQYVDIGRRVFWENQYTFDFNYDVSHDRIIPENMAESGGEGDGARENFRDTAYFKTLKTDAKGHASAEFTLPDNITAWRLIWQAYMPDIWVGNGTGSIPVTKPFFTDSRFNGPILTGDEAVLGLRAAGTIIRPEASNAVSWSVEIPEASFSRQVSGAPFIWNDCNLPALQAGIYTLQITAKYLDRQDITKQTFEVLDSGQSYQKQDTVTLTQGYRPSGDTKGLTTLTFANRKRSQALQGLWRLANQDSIRVEQSVASYAAQQLLTDYFKMPWWQPEAESLRQKQEQLLRYQKFDGGIGILPYAESSLEVSALIASTVPDRFDQGALAAYFNRIRQDKKASQEDQSMALWGSAALGEPVLNEIKAMLGSSVSTGQTMAGEVKLNLLLGLVCAGDGAHAASDARQFIMDWTEDLGTSMRAVIDGNADTTVKATARLAMLANMLQLPESEKLYQYVLENQRDSDYFLLEQLAILKARANEAAQEANFTYGLDGETVKVDLLENPYYTLTLTPKQMAGIDFKAVNGEVTVSSLYQTTGLPQASGTASKELSVTREFRVADKVTQSLPVQGKVLVTIHYKLSENAPQGCYNLVDFLPAGLRFVAMDSAVYQENDHPWLLQQNGSKLVFGFYKGDQAVEKTLRYYARVAMPGTFRGEAPYLNHSRQPQTLAAGQETKVVIR